MKTRHIIAIGLLSALAVGILGLAIHTGKAKAKTLQTKADNTNITTLADTQWQFYETFNPNDNSQINWQVNFASNNEYFKAIEYDDYMLPTRITYKTMQNTYINVYDSNSNGWQNDNYRTIFLVNGTDITNNNLIEFVSTYAINKTITNLTNTSWQFYDNVIGIGPWASNSDYWEINFISNDENFVRLAMSNDFDPIKIFYNTTPNIYNNIVYDNGTWANNNYKTIHITGGQHATWVNAIEFMCLHAFRTNTIYDDIYNQGYTNGYNIGYTNGENTGYQTGYTAGETAGYQTGYTAGETSGYQTGYEDGLTAEQTEIYNQGKEIGYALGYNDSEAFNHPIALQPLLLNILTMPFTFISQAFDVTLWPGTQYEFNFANFFKGMIAIATIMFIIKLFTSGFSILGNYTGNHYQNKLTRQKIKESKSRTALNNRTDPNNKTIKKG